MIIMIIDNTNNNVIISRLYRSYWFFFYGNMLSYCFAVHNLSYFNDIFATFYFFVQLWGGILCWVHGGAQTGRSKANGEYALICNDEDNYFMCGHCKSYEVFDISINSMTLWHSSLFVEVALLLPL